MNRSARIFLYLITLAIIVVVIGYRQYNKPHRDAETAPVAHTLTAEALFAAFDTDETTATRTFGDQLVEVSGTVQEVALTDTSGAMLLLGSEHPLFGVKCLFQDALQNVPKTGENATIRGFCAGMNGDVELTRCTLVTDQNQSP